MKSKSYKVQIQEYKDKYGLIPTEKENILSYLDEKLKLTEKDYERIKAENDYAESIPWDTLKIILPIIPKPSPRPRISGRTGTFYVTGAAENKKLFKYYVEDLYHIIYTQTYFGIKTYLPTPVSQMNKVEIYRAEEEKILPPSNPDWDNLGKAYSDMIQHILILNDNIITKGFVEKFYSVKPRVEISIKYQKGFDSKFNRKRIEKSKSYKDAIEVGHILEVYEERSGFW